MDCSHIDISDVIMLHKGYMQDKLLAKHIATILVLQRGLTRQPYLHVVAIGTIYCVIYNNMIHRFMRTSYTLHSSHKNFKIN